MINASQKLLSQTFASRDLSFDGYMIYNAKGRSVHQEKAFDLTESMASDYKFSKTIKKDLAVVQ